MRGLLAALSFGLCLPRVIAGNVIGNVIEASNRGALPGAVISVMGRSEETEADADGSYVLHGLAAGTYQVQFRYLGYDTKTVPVTVPDSGDVPRGAAGPMLLAKLPR